MARLTRVRQKVFASNASNNGVFGSLQAGNPQTSNDVATLQSLSAFENGWDDAIEQGDKLPPLEEFQGIQYGISYQQAYMLQEGIAEWDANTPYYKGGLVKTISGTSFKLYCSLADNNTNKAVTNTSYWKKVMDSDDLYAYDSAVVHLAGTETITGAKTFMATQYIGNSSITKGTAPASATHYGLYFVDKNGTNWSDDQLGQIQMQCAANGDNVININAIQQTAGSTNNAGIKIAIKQNGDAYTSAPTPTDTTSTSSSQIATVGWINSTGNNVAHLSGTETFSGNKTFLGSVSLGALATATAPTDTTSTSSTKVATVGWVNRTGNNIVHLDSSETITGEKTFTGTTRAEKDSAGFYQTYIKNTAVTVGTAPSTNTGYQLIMNDSSGVQNGRIGALTLVYKSDGSCESYLTAYKPVGTGQTNSTMGVTYPASGNPYGYAPTPSDATDNSTKIATTAWIHTFLTTNDADAFSTWTKASKGGFKLANGLIVNWGRATSETITFAVPFSGNTSYSVSVAVGGTEQGATSWGQVNTLTSTGFKAVGASSSRTIYWLAIGY